ncbi:MAG: DUF2232 domain-containing protein [Deltaproteobacteria bacterium]|nr:DUF2232 domain-containing protein [Deltaproteobacteria bacterium]MBW2084753.1 DUF2232 domain-containing protein [Deltaproteobacteria bacterium]
MSEDHEVRSTVGLVIRDPALVLGILASVFLFFSMLLFPVFGILVGLFTPLPLLYFYYQRGRTIGLVMIGLATLVVGIIFFMDSNLAGGLMFLGYGLLVVVMAESLRFSLPPEKVIGYPAAALLGLGLAVLIVSSTFHGQSPWAYGQNVIKTHIEETFRIYQDILTAAQQSRAPLESDQAEDRSGITGEDEGRKIEAEFPSAAPDEEFGKLASLFVRIFPGLMIIGVLLLAWINFMAVRWLLAWKGVLPHHLADLKKWKAPEVLIWGVILFGFCVILPIEASRSIGLNGLMVLALIYFFAGLSVVAYWFDLKAVPRFFRVITYMIIALQQYLGLIIVGLGLFDLWFDFRRLKKAQSNS